jgi:hypothetical protein
MGQAYKRSNIKCGSGDSPLARFGALPVDLTSMLSELNMRQWAVAVVGCRT